MVANRLVRWTPTGLTVQRVNRHPASRMGTFQTTTTFKRLNRWVLVRSTPVQNAPSAQTCLTLGRRAQGRPRSERCASPLRRRREAPRGSVACRFRDCRRPRSRCGPLSLRLGLQKDIPDSVHARSRAAKLITEQAFLAVEFILLLDDAVHHPLSPLGV